MDVIAILLINLMLVALMCSSGYALTRLRRPKLAAVLVALTVALLVAGNTQATHWIHQHPPCFSDGCDTSPD